MIPMFRVWEMGNERATTTECLSDAQSILIPGSGPKRETDRSVVVMLGGREVGYPTLSCTVLAVAPGWKEAPMLSALPFRLATLAPIVLPYFRSGTLFLKLS
jgi:hypothetical protein